MVFGSEVNIKILLMSRIKLIIERKRLAGRPIVPKTDEAEYQKIRHTVFHRFHLYFVATELTVFHD